MRNVLTLYFGLWQLVLASVCFSSNAHADTIYMYADDWCPYNCTPESEKPGFVIEIGRAIFEEYGHSVVYRRVPWERAIVMARKGDIHAIVGADQIEAPDFIFPENEQGVMEYRFYTQKNNPWVYSGLSSLGSQQLGVINGYSYSTELDKYIEETKKSNGVQVVYGVNPLEQNVRKILLGRLSVLVDDASVVSHGLLKLNASHLFREAGVLTGYKIYIAFSPNHPKSQHYAEILSVGMDALRKSGKLQQIMESYGLNDWIE